MSSIDLAMLFRKHRNRGAAQRYGNSLALMTSLAIAVWAADGLGWLRAWDGVVYDAIARFQNVTQRAPARTVLCYVDPELATDQAAMAGLVESITAYEPAGIVFTFDNQLQRTANATPWLLSAVASLPSPLVSSRPGPDGDLQAEGLVYLPVAEHGVQRWHRGWTRLGDRTWPSVEVAAARRAGVAIQRIPNRFRIYFRGAAGSLPYVTADQILNQELVEALLRDQVVLLGPRDVDPYGGLATPTTDDEFQMSALEYHGHALNSLLIGRAATDVSSMGLCAILLGVGAMLPTIYRRSRLGPGVVVMLLLIATTLLVSYLCLRFALIWLHPGSLLLLCVAGCFATWETQIERLQLRTLEFCSDVVTEQRRLEWPSKFVESPDPWNLVAKMFNELLHPQRCVLMATVEGEMYVRGMRTLRCEFTDIVERRRDLRRDPYERADEEGMPIYLDPQQPFLEPHEGESQYLAPLKFRGDLRGFVIVSVRDEAVGAIDEFIHSLRKLADEAAEMLQRRRELELVQGHSRPDESGDLESWEDSLATAQTATRRLRSNVSRLEAVLLSAPTPLLLFDAYGHTLLTNRKMEELLLAEEIASRSAALEVLAKLWQGPREELRKVVLQVASGQETYVRVVSLHGSSYAFLLTPVPARAQGISDDVYPFDLIGIRLDMIPAVGSGTFIDWLTEADRQDHDGAVEVRSHEEGESSEVP